MATAEELLAEFTQVDKTLVISNDLRTITIPPTVPNLGVESDNEVLRLNFKMPRHIGDIDLSTFTIRINSLNAKDEGDVYTVTDSSITDDDISFSWLVGPSATRYKGDTKFNVCMVVFASDGMHVMQEFNTAPATLKVLEGLEVDESLLDAGYAEGFVDGGAQLNELRRSFWRKIADENMIPGMFSLWDETTFSAMLPYPTDSEFWAQEDPWGDIDYREGPGIYCGNCDYLFYNCDRPVAYKDSGLPPLFSEGYGELISAKYMFAYSTFTEIPYIYFGYMSNMSNASYMFYNAKCRKMTLCLGWDVGPINLGKTGFISCSDLEEIELPESTICESWDLHWSTKLTKNSLLNVINCLTEYPEDYDLTNPTLTLGKTNLDKLTDAEKAIATQKGWTLA